ncbi:uncharacterized protein LOC111327089 [Stylophora pistillata]|uniref:uncharacterized protein LOC111327089 n=1 Tax=Stylophora pistillata TaxID=50429 RepID=UPI000C04D545|nr:uncharacterized protein LOC111327089 [Stylophora pistillata]
MRTCTIRKEVSIMETLLSIMALIILSLQHKRSHVSAHFLQGRNVHGHWLLDGSDPDVSFSSSVSFTKGRCPHIKAADFFAKTSYATVPTTHITPCDFTIAFWMKIPSHHFNTFRNTVVFTAISTDGHPLFLSLSKQKGEGIHFLWGRMFGLLTKLVVSIGQIRFDQWTHLAATCQETKVIRLYVDGVHQTASVKRNTSHQIFNYHSDMAEPSNFSNSYYYIGGWPFKDRFSIRSVEFFGSLMNLHVIGVALTPDEIYDLYKDYPLIINVTLTDAKRNTVNVEWEPPSCPADIKMYFVCYREIYSRDWTTIGISSNVTSYHLQLESSREYEIAVTTREINKDLPRNLWRVRTLGVKDKGTGNKTKNRLKALVISGSVAAVVAVTLCIICYKMKQLHAVLEKRFVRYTFYIIIA